MADDVLKLTLRPQVMDAKWTIRMTARNVQIRSTVRNDLAVETKVPIMFVETGAGGDWSATDW